MKGTELMSVSFGVDSGSNPDGCIMNKYLKRVLLTLLLLFTLAVSYFFGIIDGYKMAKT
jgi:hypothetical protein